MSPEQFCYWLQGFSELSGHEPPTEAQWEAIQDHLNTVFEKVTKPVVDFDKPQKWPIPYPAPMPSYPPGPTTMPYVGDGKPVEIIC